MAKKDRRQIVKSDFSPVFRHFVNLLCNRVVVNNLPEEINEKFLLYEVLLFGRILFFKKNGKYHVMWFSGKGKRNEYYIQREFLIVNPWAKETNGSYDEENACILYSDINAYVDNCDVGLYDIVEDYAEIINAIDKSIRALAKNSKVIAFLTGSTKSFVSSAKETIKALLNSDDCIGVMEESLVDSIKVNPISEKMDYKFSELIKARQYYISDFYQKIGISANMNMKAERLTDNESQLIDSCAEIDFEHIIDNLNFSVAKINEMFGLNISFELNEEEEQVVDNSEQEMNEDESNEKSGGEVISEDGTERTSSAPTERSVSGDEDVSNRTESDNSDSENSVDGESVDGGTGTDDTEIDGEEDNQVEVNIEINVNGETTEDKVVDNSDEPSEDNEEETEEKKKEVE